MDIQTDLILSNLFYLQSRDRAGYPIRYYILHDNSIVYLNSGREGELYKLKKSNHKMYAINPKTTEYPERYGVYTGYTPESGDIYYNGNFVEKLNEVSFQEFWYKYGSDPLIDSKSADNSRNMRRPFDLTDIENVMEKLKELILLKNTRESWEYIERKDSGKKGDTERYMRDIKTTREINEYLETLPEIFPRLKYKEDNDRTGLHHRGQLKLLCSEIEFLTRYSGDGCPKSNLVVYAGAASGIHIPLLAAMFPMCIFILFDGAEFEIAPSKNIIIRRELFTMKIVDEFQKDPILFISDIRSTPDKKSVRSNTREKDRQEKKDYMKEFERHVRKNMNDQLLWTRKMNVHAAMLKFRLPYDEGKMKYSAGEIRLQTWAPVTSTETRMIIEKDGKHNIQIYDQRDYEEKLFYFNKKYRRCSFRDIHPVFGACYDTLRQYYILKRYIENYRIGNETMKQSLDDMSLDSVVYLFFLSFDMYLYRDNYERYTTLLL